MEDRMAMMRDDPAVHLTFDANAIAGLLATIFRRDVTPLEEQCGHCGTVSLVGTLRVYMRGPGVIVRCPACADVILRIVELPGGRRVELPGATRLSVPR